MIVFSNKPGTPCMMWDYGKCLLYGVCHQFGKALCLRHQFRHSLIFIIKFERHKSYCENFPHIETLCKVASSVLEIVMRSRKCRETKL